MTTVFNQSSQPLGGPERVTGRAQADPPADAWRREMEKAQAASWFHGATAPSVGSEQAQRSAAPIRVDGHEVLQLGHAVPPRPAAPHQVAVPRRPDPDFRIAATPSLIARAVSAPPTSATSFSDAQPTMAWDCTGAAPAEPSERTGSRAFDRAILAAVPHEADNPHSSGSVGSQRHMRVHVEQGQNGLSVWLGLDGKSSSDARVAAIVADLQRELQNPRRPLALVVCNGRTVYVRDAAASVGEPAAHRAHPNDHQEG